MAGAGPDGPGGADKGFWAMDSIGRPEQGQLSLVVPAGQWHSEIL